MFEVGRVCLKIAGRDAGKKAVIVKVEKDGFVLVDGEVRRRKVNSKHLEPLDKVLKIKENASLKDIKSDLEKLGFEIKERKPKKAQEKPKKATKSKASKTKKEA